MFFEDEKDKDIIIDPDANLEISDDGTVSWDDILVDNDEIVSIKDSNKTHTQQNNNTDQNDSKTAGADSLDDDLIDLGDDLEFIDDETLLFLYDSYGYEDVIYDEFGLNVEIVESGSIEVMLEDLNDD